MQGWERVIYTLSVQSPQLQNTKIDRKQRKGKRIEDYSRNRAAVQIPSPLYPLYKSLVRPYLEHAVQFWSPHLRRDIYKIENIKRRATKMIPVIRNHSYHQRIQELDLISLVQRRLRGQLIEVFKYLNRFTTAQCKRALRL